MTSLTQQAQDLGSALYTGLVTDRIDPQWGIVAISLDVSLRLTMAISVVGGDQQKQRAVGWLMQTIFSPFPSVSLPPFFARYYLNQGANRWCKEGALAENSTVTSSAYCLWEGWFETDITGALGLSEGRVSVLFVKQSALDSVLVHFRLGPPSNYSTEVGVRVRAASGLLSQLRNLTSPLYSGNVTVTVDPAWGLSGEGGIERTQS
ncbi:unnamed protein product, partial [Discosporangium mesarthrocarpum]